jgi:hypothetical protein
MLVAFGDRNGEAALHVEEVFAFFSFHATQWGFPSDFQ